MTIRYSTANRHEAEAAVDLLRSQGYQAQAQDQTDGKADLVVVLDRDSIEAVELLLRRAPSAQRLH